MSTGTWWLWLITLWLTEAVHSPGTSVCDLQPCQCSRGQLVCDCSTSVIQDILLRDDQYQLFSFSTISVSRCGHVHVGSEALSGLSALQQITISNVGQLTLEERSFNWVADPDGPSLSHRGLLVNISNTHVPEVPSYTFKGTIREILFSSVNISRVRTFAFGSINHADKIEFTKVTFKEIETQSFKKLSVDFLMFRETNVNLIPERTFMDIEVHQELRLDTVRIGKVKSNAFRIYNPKNVKIVQSVIDKMESKAFHVHTKGDVSIRDNVFNNLEEKAFLGFTVERKYFEEAGKEDIVFENNTIVKFEAHALSFNTTCLNLRLDRVIVKQPCSCSGSDLWTTDLVSTGPIPKTPARLDTAIYCLNPNPTSVKDYLRFNCFVAKSSLLLKVSVGIGVLLVLVAVGIFVFCRFRKKGKRYINVATGGPPPRPAESHKPHMLVVPEGKTYRETELHVIVDHAEPIVHLDYVKERPDVNDNQ